MEAQVESGWDLRDLLGKVADGYVAIETAKSKDKATRRVDETMTRNEQEAVERARSREDAAVAKSNATTKYALFGGGALVLLVVLVLAWKS